MHHFPSDIDIRPTPRGNDLIGLAALALLTMGAAGSVLGGVDTALADAVERRDVKRAEMLLKQGANLDAAQADGMTVLHWATYHNLAGITGRLLDAGAKASVTNRYGVAPLSLACTNGNVTIVAALLKAGADANTTLRGGETALMTAARTGRPEVVRLLLAKGARVNDRERRGQSAIMWAAAEGHAAIVRILLEGGAEFRKPLKSGFTPLFFAVREGRTDVVDVLLQAGADVDEVMQPAKPGGKSPRRGTSPLMLAVENGHFELAVKLIDAGADPNDQRSGFTPLHAITWVRKPNRGDGPDGDPAPRGSGRLSSLEFIRRLVARGADINARLKHGRSARGRINKAGATPFLFAAKTADVAMLQLLLELGADPHLTNLEGCTPLMAAAGVGTIAPGEEAGNEEEVLQTIQLLLAQGAKINVVDKNGETPMHGAAYKNLPQAVRLLGSRGADINLWNRKNKHGWTPLLIAEGHRVGNFKPSATTVAAIHDLMRKAGITPPPPTPRKAVKGYQRRD